MNDKVKAIINVTVVGALSVALLFGMSAITDTLTKKQEEDAAKASFAAILPAEKLEPLPVNDAEGIVGAYRGNDKDGKLIGYAVTAKVKGYGGDMEVHVTLSPDGKRFLGLRVGAHEETTDYGSKTAEPAFTDQFTDVPAPVALGSYTGMENAPSAPHRRDGTYQAEQPAFVKGYRYFVELTVRDNQITAVNWDAYKEGSTTTKKKESQEGTYIMTETGKRWHEQAAIMEKALMESGDPQMLRYQSDTGKTDAYAGVSVTVEEFVTLAKEALAKANTSTEKVQEIDGVSGATVSSKSVIKAANLAYAFVAKTIR